MLLLVVLGQRYSMPDPYDPPMPGWLLLLIAILWPLAVPFACFALVSKLAQPRERAMSTDASREASESDSKPANECQFCLNPIPTRATYCPRCGHLWKSTTGGVAGKPRP